MFCSLGAEAEVQAVRSMLRSSPWLGSLILSAENRETSAPPSALATQSVAKNSKETSLFQISERVLNYFVQQSYFNALWMQSNSDLLSLSPFLWLKGR